MFISRYFSKTSKNKMMALGTPVASYRKAHSACDRRIDLMGNAKKNILVVEQDSLMRIRFNAAFLHSGYDVQITDRIAEAIEMVSSGARSSRPFDLVIVDISDGNHLGLVADVQNINSKLPVFTLRDATDKSMVINLLNQKQTEFIEHYISNHASA